MTTRCPNDSLVMRPWQPKTWRCELETNGNLRFYRVNLNGHMVVDRLLAEPSIKNMIGDDKLILKWNSSKLAMLWPKVP